MEGAHHADLSGQYDLQIISKEMLVLMKEAIFMILENLGRRTHQSLNLQTRKNKQMCKKAASSCKPNSYNLGCQVQEANRNLIINYCFKR